MNPETHISPLVDKAEKFYRIALASFKLPKLLIGTRVIVTRVKETSKYNNVFGKVYTSNLLLDSDTETFQVKLLLSQETLSRIHALQAEILEVYDRESLLKTGDLVTYQRRDLIFRFKVKEIEALANSRSSIYKYTLVGIKESTN